MTTYNITTIAGDTIEEIAFTVTVDSVALDLTGADIVVNSQPAGINLAVGAGITVTSAAAGQFKINSQILSTNPGTYNYFVKFFLADGTVQTYITGLWTVEFKG